MRAERAAAVQPLDAALEPEVVPVAPAADPLADPMLARGMDMMPGGPMPQAPVGGGVDMNRFPPIRPGVQSTFGQQFNEQDIDPITGLPRRPSMVR